MAWTAPKTWVFEETPTYTNFNLHIRDNLVYLKDRTDITGSNISGCAISGSHISGCAISGSHVVDNAIDDRTAGSRMPQFYRRQGGNAGQWANAGSTTYIPDAVRMQAGAASALGTAAGSTRITYPTAFSQIPLVFLSIFATGSPSFYYWMHSISNTYVDVSWASTSGCSYSTEMLFWLAIGPE